MTTFDLVTGRLLICEISHDIFQVEPDGTRVSAQKLVTLRGAEDVDDLAVDPETGTIWIASDHLKKIMEFDREEEVQALHSAGEPVAGQEARDLPSFGQAAFLTQEIGGADTAATVAMRGTKGPIQGFFMLGDFDMKRLDGIGRSLEASTLLHIPQARSAGQDVTVLYLFNPSLETRSHVTVSLFDTQGRRLREVSLLLEPSGSFMGRLDELTGGDLHMEDGFITIAASDPIQGFALFAQEKSFSTIAGQPGTPVSRLFSPHFFLGGARNDAAASAKSGRSRYRRAGYRLRQQGGQDGIDAPGD